MKKRKTKEGTVCRFLLICLVILLLMGIVFTMTCGAVLATYVQKSVEKEIDESIFLSIGSGGGAKLYYFDRTGEAVELTDSELYGGYRSQYVHYSNLPKNLINAFVSIEDKRFFEHKGVDWKRTVSASLNYFLKFSDSFGGSTITQQLIKNITDKDEYSFQRKIQEIFWALDLETKMDKNEILELYVNIINLSQGCYGVGAAADYYYSKCVSELTLSECATIAAITNNPSYYDPIRNPDHNLKRRNLILGQMLEQGYISEQEYQEAVSEDLILNLSDEGKENTVHSWYVDMVIEDVIQDLMNQYGYSREMANLMLYAGGMKIYTAIDPQVQTVLNNYYADVSHFQGGNTEKTMQSAMIVMDPKTGDILGVAGAVGEKNENRLQNYATQTLRPAGSVIKPLSVFAPAMENGVITWGSVYDDTPVNFGPYNLDETQGSIVQPVEWPKNANGVYGGLTDINTALEQSVNTVSVKVLEDLGLENSFSFLTEKLHINNLISEKRLEDGRVITDQDYASLALGQFNYGVTVREMTSAYSALANEGIYSHARSYHQVTDANGNVLLSKPYSGETVFSEETAAIMTRMLQNVVDSGTGKAITLKNSVACAGKTGTTQNNYDRWFVGYTPYLLGGIWCGYEYPQSLTAEESRLCLRVWDEVMTLLHERYEDKKNTSFSMPDRVVLREYCADSGGIPTEACHLDPRHNRVEYGYFVIGTEPAEYCDCHVLVDYDMENGGVSLGDCSFENTEKVGLICVNRSFPKQIYVTDAQYVWKQLDPQTMPETAPTLPFFQNMLKESEFVGISRGDEQYNRLCRVHFKWKKNQ